ncbi:hypothetical protein [Kribbella sp. NPDC051620]|uniref:hypothetical protein n=1 Tax=Kribbella sp. NPDC051620 TaxID=3364120 RepID=UPI00379379CC
MLSCPEQDVRDAASIRVTPYLLTSRWWSWVCRYAGPATRADLREAIESADDEMLWRWYRSMEEILASPDDELRDAVLHVIPQGCVGYGSGCEGEPVEGGLLQLAR